MEFATDLMNSLRDRVGACSGSPASDAIDWFSLQTRFAAAHAARRELARIESVPAPHAGGFGEWSGVQGRQDGGQGHASRHVNPNDLAVRKGAAGMDGLVTKHASVGRG